MKNTETTFPKEPNEIKGFKKRKNGHVEKIYTTKNGIKKTRKERRKSCVP
jgi:hypothetical protein